jgi:hypothetical protein
MFAIVQFMAQLGLALVYCGLSMHNDAMVAAGVQILRAYLG